MRILHLGWGFRPWRPGGLIAYTEDVMTGQVRAGHAVAYFGSGRHYPGLRRPRMITWRRGGVQVYEVLNSPFHLAGDAGTRHPERDLAEPFVEAYFRRVLARALPEVLHVQELSAVPSSLLDIAREAGVPTVMTLQDYVPLCPTIKLYDADGGLCRRREPGAMCRVCCRDAPADPGHLQYLTGRYERPRLERRIPFGRPLLAARRGARTALRRARARAGSAPATPPDATAAEPQAPPLPPAEAYDRRRHVNVARLNRVDAVVAMSTRVAELYAELGVDPARLRVMHLTLAHVEHLAPHRLTAPPAPVRFVTLAGASNPAKGAELLLDATGRLAAEGLGADYELRVLGPVHPPLRGAFEQMPGVVLQGAYGPRDLDAILAAAHVGIIPSVWEEAYGYVGVEFLAKGIPVIGSARGGITDYTVPGRTGWLNHSVTGAELAAIMADIIRRPEQVVALNASILERRDELIKPMSRHLAELEGLYRSAGREAGAATASAGARPST